MLTRFKIDRPLDIELTMTITMSLREWVDVRDELSRATMAGTEFGRAIDSMVRKADREFVERAPPEGG